MDAEAADRQKLQEVLHQCTFDDDANAGLQRLFSILRNDQVFDLLLLLLLGSL